MCEWASDRMHCTSFVVVVVSLRFFIYLSQYFTVPRRKFESPYQGKAQQPQEQRYPFLPVCVVLLCVQTMVYGCQNLEYLTCTQILMNAIAHGGGTDTVRECAPEVNSERKKSLSCLPACLSSVNFSAWKFMHILLVFFVLFCLLLLLFYIRPPACVSMSNVLSVCLFACLLVCLSIALTICLPVSLSACLSLCVSVCLSPCLPACLFVCPFSCLFVRTLDVVTQAGRWTDEHRNQNKQTKNVDEFCREKKPDRRPTCRQAGRQTDRQGFFFLFFRWGLRTLYLHACQVRVTVGDSGLCCACVTSFER